MNFDTPTFLANHHLVTDVYGYWPSFHDAEVRSLLLDRNRILFDEIADARIELVVHCMEMKKEDDGSLVFVKHHLVGFEFSSVDEVELSGFNHQNAIYSLQIEERLSSETQRGGVKVTLDPAMGLGGSFLAYEGKVSFVTPCTLNGEALTS